jgi:hypothetical protein
MRLGQGEPHRYKIGMINEERTLTDSSGFQNQTGVGGSRMIHLQPAINNGELTNSLNHMTLLEYSRVTSSTPLGYSLGTPMAHLPENKN